MALRHSTRSCKLELLYTWRLTWRSLSTSTSANPSTVTNKLTPAQVEKVHTMIRVNHAGEIGATSIYAGQMAIFRLTDPKIMPLIQHMWNQEKVHLSSFDTAIIEHDVRPSLLRPLWEAAGFALGATTALMGRKAGMACTESVETVIGGHYNDQLRQLAEIKDNKDIKHLSAQIAKFRDEELEHLDHAIQHDALNAPLYSVLSRIVQLGCKTAIQIAKKI